MTDLGYGDLVLCAATVGDATFEDLVFAAQISGCAGISVRPGPALDAIGRHGGHGARRVLEDAGVVVADVDALLDWIDDPSFRLPSWVPAEAIVSREEFFELACQLGARAINVVDLSLADRSVEVLADSFAAVCERAAEFGLLAYVEFFKGSAIKDLATAAAIVRRADMHNGGVLLDTFHYHRGPSLAESQLDANVDTLRMLQISDASAVEAADEWEERTAGRLLPGEGSIDLVGLLARVRDAEVAAPLGLEISSAELHALEPAEAARRAADALRRVLERVPDPPMLSSRSDRSGAAKKAADRDGAIASRTSKEWPR